MKFLPLLLTAVCALGAKIPAPSTDVKTPAAKTATAVFAGGCFWGVEAVFEERLKGVSEAVSGFAGGKKETAHYDIVSEGRSGHAESVKITYDPSQITYGQLLQVFFSVAHDPTELNRQRSGRGHAIPLRHFLRR